MHQVSLTTSEARVKASPGGVAAGRNAQVAPSPTILGCKEDECSRERHASQGHALNHPFMLNPYHSLSDPGTPSAMLTPETPPGQALPFSPTGTPPFYYHKPLFNHAHHSATEQFAQHLHHQDSRFSQPLPSKPFTTPSITATPPPSHKGDVAWRPITENAPRHQHHHHRDQFPTHFNLGSLIQLSNGDLKKVENLTTEDFIQSAQSCQWVKIDQSIVTSLDLELERGTVRIAFSVGNQKVQVKNCAY